MLIGAYAVIAVLAYVFLSVHVAPCLGLGDNAACTDAWMASRSWFETLWDTALPEIAGFLFATLATMSWVRRPSRQRTGTMDSSER